MAKILMVVSAADRLTLADGTAHPTGFWAEEVAVSHRVLRDAGLDVDIATPGGARPTIDPISLDERGGVEEGAAAEFRSYLDSITDELAKPLALADVKEAEYDGVYIPGGHGPMEDLAHDADLGRLLTAADRDGKIVAALCHGPAGLLSASGASGESRDTGAGFAFAGRRLTVFSDEEERQGLGNSVPYFVESRLRDLGAIVETGPAWANNVVADGNLITGQNPQSSAETARHVVTALKEHAVA
jgi:putative intracellular protease/amidase